ncbi:MAG TPA: NAD(P)-dependent oxidoreductase [Verrucomicrobiae bacterium]|nr:NAD(P)-dependent oxidoreductase [Verrucomicrobiae bacterium]
MKILLTGATGFIGGAFARLALARGHQVAGLIIPTEKVPAGLADEKGLTWLRGKLDEAPWAEIAAFQAEVCVHTAWITTPGVYLESPENERFRDISLHFLRKVHQAGTEHIVSLGTCIEYQITNQRLAEDSTPVIPTTTYARCKNELRLALEAEAHAGKMRVCWGRVFYPYGPGEHPSRLCSSLIQKLGRGEKVFLKTPGSTKDYIYIDDVAAAVLTLVEKKATGSVNLGTGIGNSVRTLARGLAQILGKENLVQEANPPEPDPFPYVVADATRLRSLGWQPSVSIEVGLRRLVEHNTTQR